LIVGQARISTTINYLIIDQETLLAMKVNILSLTGKTTTFDVEKSDTIESLKLKYQEEQGVPPDKQRLIFNAREMEDPRTLADYDIDDGAVIRVVLKWF